MKRYRIVDYFGSIRDFEAPTDFRVSVNGAAATPRTPTSISNVISTDHDQTGSPSDELDDPNSTTGDGRASYRIDYGLNTGALATPVLQPGDNVVFTFTIKANRNQHLQTKPLRDGGDDANFERGYEVGGTRANEGGTVEVSDAHTYTEYQTDYCDDISPMKPQGIDFQPGDVVAPFLQTQRGSVHSNNGIFGYAAGSGINATYTVTAGGDIAKFTGQTAISDYQASQRTPNCTTAGSSAGINWRKEMVSNIANLVANANNSSNPNSNIVNPGNGSGKGGQLGSNQVYVFGSPSNPSNFTIDEDIAWSGVGTIVVFGDLTITGNWTYANSQSSLGVIVIGNLAYDPAVTSAVGSYYVSDVDFNRTPLLDPASGCPTVKLDKGIVSTGKSSTALLADGLFVARTFDFGRYYANPDSITPAERIYYDGRVLGLTPPGFTAFARNTSWYEVTPGQ